MKNNNKKLRLALISLLAIAQNSFAGVSNVNTKATAVMANTCQMQMNDMSFGQLHPGDPTASTSATLTMLCTTNTTYSVELTYSQADYKVSQAQMRGATSADAINFVMVNPQTGGLMGGVHGVNDYIHGTGTGQNQTYTMAAQIIGAVPYVTPDTYSDTVTLTLTY